MCGLNDDTSSCPFASTEYSEQAQNYGCLPTRQEIEVMRVKYGRTWACHDNPRIPCLGAIDYLRECGKPYSVLDASLLTEVDKWDDYVI